MDNNFWLTLDDLIAACELVIDRPKGARHPRYPSMVYPLDYGYLEGSCATADDGGIDVWTGSMPERTLTAVICTADTVKRDAEIKLLLGCTPQEMEIIADFHNTGPQSAILIKRPAKLVEKY